MASVADRGMVIKAQLLYAWEIQREDWWWLVFLHLLKGPGTSGDFLAFDDGCILARCGRIPASDYDADILSTISHLLQ